MNKNTMKYSALAVMAVVLTVLGTGTLLQVYDTASQQVDSDEIDFYPARGPGLDINHSLELEEPDYTDNVTVEANESEYFVYRNQEEINSIDHSMDQLKTYGVDNSEVFIENDNIILRVDAGSEGSNITIGNGSKVVADVS